MKICCVYLVSLTLKNHTENNKCKWYTGPKMNTRGQRGTHD